MQSSARVASSRLSHRKCSSVSRSGKCCLSTMFPLSENVSQITTARGTLKNWLTDLPRTSFSLFPRQLSISTSTESEIEIIRWTTLVLVISK